jgi:hypothetical protein
MSRPEASVSPYLPRLCRSLEQARRDRSESATIGSNEGYRAGSSTAPVKESAHDAPMGRW